MELTEKEIGYLELYKGKSKGIKRLDLDINEKLEGYYSYVFEFQNLNRFMNFLATKNPLLMENMYTKMFGRDFLDNIIDMILTISDIACRYALDNRQYYDCLFRFENKNNLKDYEEGNSTNCFKSTSTSDSESSVFNKPDTIGLVFKTNDFIPHIYIDEIIDSNEFSDEKEILFPPFIRGVLTGKKEKHHYWEFYEVTINDSFSIMDEKEDFGDYGRIFASIKDDFTNELDSCKKNKIVSDKLKSYCDIVYKYLYTEIRNMYIDYSTEYKLRKLERRSGMRV